MTSSSRMSVKFMLAVLCILGTSTDFALAQDGSGAGKDIRILIRRPEDWELAGVRDDGRESLEELKKLKFFNRNGLSSLESASKNVFIESLAEVEPKSCNVPKKKAGFLVSEENSGGRRLHQCVPFFEPCARAVSAAVQAPDDLTAFDISSLTKSPSATPSAAPSPSPSPSLTPSPVLLTPSPAPTPSPFLEAPSSQSEPDNVFVSICLKQKCTTFYVESTKDSGDILSAGDLLCPDKFKNQSLRGWENGIPSGVCSFCDKQPFFRSRPRELCCGKRIGCLRKLEKCGNGRWNWKSLRTGQVCGCQ